MSDHWLADRIMSSQSVRDAGLSWDQVVAVLRGMADYELWKKSTVVSAADPRLAACRFCHAVADDIQKRYEVERAWATDYRQQIDRVRAVLRNCSVTTDETQTLVDDIRAAIEGES